MLLFSTMTLDGRIASSTGYSMLSCSYDLARLRLLRGYVEAVMVGANTVLADNPSLEKRIEPRTARYYRIIVDGRLRTARHADKLRIYSGQGPPVIVITGLRDKEAIRLLKEHGASIVVAGSDGRVDLRRALNILLEEYEINSILVEGGGILAYNLARSGLLDEVRVTVTPFVFGSGRSIFDDPQGRGFTTTAESPKLELKCVEHCPCGHCIHLAYRFTPCCPAESSPEIPYCLSSRLAAYLSHRVEKG